MAVRLAVVGLSVSVAVLWKAIQSLGSLKAPSLLDNRIFYFDDVHMAHVSRLALCSHLSDSVFDKRRSRYQLEAPIQVPQLRLPR